MLLSEFLRMNNENNVLKKGIRCTNQSWNDYLENIEIPSQTICENIITFLGHGNKYKEDVIRSQLIKCILHSSRPNQLVELVLHIEPYAAPRPRFTRFGRPYNPPKYQDWRRRFQSLMDWGTIEGPVEIDVEYHFLAPSKKRYGFSTINKDIDNLDKSLLDGLQSVGFIENDKFVYRMNSIKYNSNENKIVLKIRHGGIWNK